MALRSADRLIVALDVSTHEEAYELVDQLDNVSLFKVGLELVIAGNIMEFIKNLQERRSISGGVFIDLKISGDIGNTMTRMIRNSMQLNVKFLTLVEAAYRSMTVRTIAAAREARGDSAFPRLLMVPYLSSHASEDLAPDEAGDLTLTEFILQRAKRMLEYGCDGLIVSGDAIAACREQFGDSCVIVSPGIRPEGMSGNDHKRFTTPTEAIRLGADYLVVGRPVITARDPRSAAQDIIDEIERASRTHG